MGKQPADETSNRFSQNRHWNLPFWSDFGELASDQRSWRTWPKTWFGSNIELRRDLRALDRIFARPSPHLMCDRIDAQVTRLHRLQEVVNNMVYSARPTPRGREKVTSMDFVFALTLHSSDVPLAVWNMNKFKNLNFPKSEGFEKTGVGWVLTVRFDCLNNQKYQLDEM